jgi:hypothetical protein
MLQGFVLVHDEVGLDDTGRIDPFFVEWVTAPPAGAEPDDPRNAVHRRLVELSAGWTTDHPCWRPDAMPAMDDAARQ